MSCNLFSDLGGTNIRSQRWTKSSLWATATAYQKHWEPSKKAEIGWFSRKATPNFSWEARFDMTCSHQKTVLSCQGLSPWREIQQPNSVVLVENLQESSLRSFIIWNGTSQIISKKHENSVSKQEHLFIESKQRNPQEVENQRSKILFQTGILRGSNF